MKIKQTPNDFIVREINNPHLNKNGRYAVYQLTKNDIGTIEVIQVINQRWGVKRNDISAGGLKDKYARTEQLISVYKGCRDNFQHHLFNLKYLGQSEKPIRPDSFDVNHFCICIRELGKSDIARIKERLQEIRQFGMPNYFDEQRFGSVRSGNEFPARQLILRDAEGALKNVLTSTSRKDHGLVKQIRNIISDNWGNWAECLKLLPHSSERRIMTYLKKHPANFRQAFELIDPNIVLLYLHSYQSYLWNNGVSRFLIGTVKDESLIKYPYLLGEFIFYRRLKDDTLSVLKEQYIPFVTHKTIFSDETIAGIFIEILKEEEIETSDFRIRGMQKTYFRKGERRVLVFPLNLAAKDAGPDELNKNKLKMTLEFDLPRGAYATILIKRLCYGFNHII
ncbi:MAG: tRNA pseudouridine(13) synthase TruD [Planctomycetota bacterium]